MPQNPLAATIATNPSGQQAPLKSDAYGNLLTSTGGTLNTYDITAATVVKATPGRIAKISIVVAGSAPGTVNDCATTGAVAVTNEIAALPNTAGITNFDWPCTTGIVVTPGTGQTVAISYE